jgi:hypothetical protein
MDSVEGDASPSGYGAETTQTATTTETAQTQGDTNNSTQGDTSSAGAPNDTTTADDKSKQTSTEEGVTGYEKPAEGSKPAEEAKPLELDLKGLEEEKVADIVEFAKAHNLTKEQAQALVDKRKGDEDAKVAAVETYKTKELEVFAKWEEELKADPDFGGENFANSVHSVNKLIREELPGLKNLLTTSGKRLPPSLMKDLNSVARKLYGETELVQGEKVNSGDTWKPTDFYKQKT